MGLTDGTLQVKDIRTKTEEKPTLLAPRTDSSILDIELWKASSGVKVVVAEDSGKVKLYDPRNNADSILISEGRQESALVLSIDSIHKTNETLLTVGYSQSMEVLDLANL